MPHLVGKWELIFEITFYFKILENKYFGRASFTAKNILFIEPMCTWGPIIGSHIYHNVSMKTVNVVNVDTLVDDPSEDLSWRP